MTAGRSDLAWLTARPVAHRGLHDAIRGVIENTASACAAALQAGYGIEVDLQLSADGDLMVHHDDTLDRLTQETGPLRKFTAAALKQIPFKDTADRMMTLGDLLDLVGGRTMLLLELKSRFDGDIRIALRAADVLRSCAGPIAAMSFDPALAATLKERAPGIVRGVVAQGRGARTHSQGGAAQRRSARNILEAVGARPHFIAWRQQELGMVLPVLARRLFRLPLLAWTVRSERERIAALSRADQVIFEGFRPPLRKQEPDMTV
jgi:glycerophosphoryl diester phosphodiesterase